MSALKNLIGQKFGRLTVIERAENKGGRVHWLCKCDCGNETVAQSNALTSGHTQSCGCIQKERAVQNEIIHGLAHSKIYYNWQAMRRRCFNPNFKQYKDYGGRGITVYEPWINDFQAFYDYVSKLEHFGEEGMTLDRIDNNGNYEPGNLQWSTKSEQGRNKRNNVIVEYSGECMTLTEAAELSGINYHTLLTRYHAGDRGARLFRPIGSK